MRPCLGDSKVSGLSLFSTPYLIRCAWVRARLSYLLQLAFGTSMRNADYNYTVGQIR
jgi:hypothetical protein